MDSIRGPIIFAFFTLASAASVALAQPQPPVSGGFAPRREAAASILRGRPILPAPEPLRQAPRVVAKASNAGMDALSQLGDLAPPPPPASRAASSGKTTTTWVTGSGLGPTTSNEYPITPGEAFSDQAPEMLFEDPYAPAPEQLSYGCDSGPSCGGCSSCGGDGWVDTISLNLGVASFKNAINNGLSGSFGFQQGFNWGSPLVFKPLGMNSQLGLRTIQSEFGGTRFDGGALNDDYRFQLFVTGGFFRRAICGWQGGVVFDYLRDEWVGSVDLGQLRGELSWAVPSGNSFGVWFATSVTEDTGRGLSTSSGTREFDTRDLYAAFFRVQSAEHRLGQWRLFAGFTGDSDGLIGSDFKIPLVGTWSMEPEFTYLIPDESTAQGGPAEESWNVAFNLVWYPGRAVRGIDYARLPLFDVASNGSMISRRVP